MKAYLPALLLLGLSFTACEKDDPDVNPPQEVITTLIYTLTPDGGGDAVSFTFRDLDGEDGNAPVITTMPLAANTTYDGTISLLNEQADPTEDITAEIREEDEEHQFFFTSTVDGTSVSYDDTDEDGLPTGLRTTVTTGDAGSGTLTVVLRHEPTKNADGDLNAAGGETDIEVDFPLVVE